ncbi:hypothetical protein HYC85_021227 [Camellia sinensis]|uniref:Uncharacterized protein n=1 Tax=Camellia sinensis TaxID=4442 RepID=A0A7J7GH16_CAMSI|nr:hypothetical protein HYC85_021227 [Camellia sinensis]
MWSDICLKLWVFMGFLQLQRKTNQAKLEDQEEQCPLQSSNLYRKTDLAAAAATAAAVVVGT